MMLAAEFNLTPSIGSSWKTPNTGGMDVRPLLEQMLYKTDVTSVGRKSIRGNQLPMAQPIRVGQLGTNASNDFWAGMLHKDITLHSIALIGLCATGALNISLYSPSIISLIDQGFAGKRVEFDAPSTSTSIAISPAAKLINEAQEISGLTLEMIAPLLGVSRRSIQYWKDGEKVSVKNELQLRGLIDALKLIATGTADETRDVLLTRITGVPRIYDLLAERRYDAAVSRARVHPRTSQF